MNGQVIPLQISVTPLGHHIGNTECKKTVIDKDISDLITRTNLVLSKFDSCDSNVRNFLFRTYCTNFYGSSLWSLSDKYIQRFYCNWPNCVWRVWNVPRNTHCRFLELLYGKNIEIELLLSFLHFYLSVMNSENHIVSTCAKVYSTSLTVAARNRRMLLYKINDDGQILEKPKHIIRRKLVAMGADDMVTSCEGSVIRNCAW